MLLKNPRVSLTVSFSLALGVAGITTAFAVIHNVLLNPLQLRHAERIVRLTVPNPPQGDPLQWWGRASGFEHLAEYWSGGLNITSTSEVQRVPAAVVSSEFFSVLGALPQIGRTFTSEDEVPGRNNVAVLSHGPWIRNFGANPNIIGQGLSLNGVPHEIVGVMGRDFSFPGRTEVWIPRSLGDSRLLFELGADLPPDLPAILQSSMIGRLRPGVEVPQVQLELQGLFAQLEREFSESPGQFGDGVSLYPLRDLMVANYRTALLSLFAALGFVLLIACANAANMLLTRALLRRKEIAVRMCFGASRFRIAQQCLAESLVIALASGLAGVLLTYWGLEVVRVIGPANVPRLAEIKVNYTTFAFALFTSLLIAVFSSLAPAFHSLRTDLTGSLKDGPFRPSGTLGLRVRSLLVVGEMCLAFILLSGAALAIQSFQRLTNVDPGFDAGKVLTMEISLPASKYAVPFEATDSRTPSITETERRRIEEGTAEAGRETTARVASFYRRAIERIKFIPGVTAAGGVIPLPLAAAPRGRLWVRVPDTGTDGMTKFGCVFEDYFQAMRIPVLKGRAFSSEDTYAGAPVAIINKTFAEQHWQEKNPIGQVVVLSSKESLGREIVGVVQGTKDSSLSEQPQPQVYTPCLQPVPGAIAPLGMVLVIRTDLEPRMIHGAIQHEVRSIDKDVALYHPRTMEEVQTQSTAPLRFRASVLGAFAFLATFLAVFGLYGAVNYSVASRIHEFGVRAALGAQRWNILIIVLRHALILALIGIALGIACTLALAQLIASLLFGIAPTDTRTLTLSAILIIGVAVASCLGPAIRASRVEPANILRFE